MKRSRSIQRVLWISTFVAASFAVTASAQTVTRGPNGITIVAAPGVTPIRLPNLPNFRIPSQNQNPTRAAIPMPSLPSPWATAPNTLTAPSAPVPAVLPTPSAPPAAAAQPRLQDHRARTFGLFVGISEYPSANDLPFCADDARRVQQSFVNAGMVDPLDTVVLTDRMASRAAVQGTLDRFARVMGPDDTLVFFFSGHGNQRPDHNGDERDGMDETIVFVDGSVTDDELASWLRPNPGREVVALDSCYSGGFQEDIAQLDNSVGLYASREDQLSYVASEYNAGGYLSYFLSRSIDQHRGQEVPMWELQRDISSGFATSQANGRQDFVVGVSRRTGTRTVLFDSPSRPQTSLVASR